MFGVYRVLQRGHREIESMLAQLETAPAEAGFDSAARRHLVDEKLAAELSGVGRRAAACHGRVGQDTITDLVCFLGRLTDKRAGVPRRNR